MRRPLAHLTLTLASIALVLGSAPLAFAAECEPGAHVPVTDEAVPATYSQTGLTEGSHCEVCGAILAKQQVVPMKALAKPAGVKAANATSGVKVSWKAVKGALGYRVYRDGKLLKTTAARTLTDKTVDEGKRCSYRVYAYAGTNRSAAATAATYRLTSIKMRSAVTGGSRFVVRWTPAATAATQKVTGYQIRYSASSSMTSPKHKRTKGATAKSRTVVISKDRKATYFVQVRAYRTVKQKNYYGPWSSVREVSLGSAKSLRKAAGIKNYLRSKLAHGPKGAKYQKYIVLHDTEGTGSALHFANFFATDGRLVAAHFVVCRDGSVGQIVPLDKIAHHAGYGNAGHNKKFGTRKDGRDDMRGTRRIGASCPDYGMNAWSIGIEIEHLHGSGYTAAQLRTLDRVIAYIDAYYGFESRIIDHKAWRNGNSDTDSTFRGYLANYQKYRAHRKPSA